MRKPVKLLLLVLALGLVVCVFWGADPVAVWDVLRSLGVYAPLVLCPYGLVYAIDTLGWRLTFGRDLPHGLTFGRLFRIRWAGESINTFVPSGYVGGEAVKVYLLHQAGVSGWSGTTSVVVSKTVQTIAQVLFSGLGALLGAMQLPSDSPFRAALWSMAGVALAVLVLLIGVQSYGFFRTLNRLASFSRRWRAWFEHHGQRIQEVDENIRSFYRRQPRSFLLSTSVYFSGWLADTLEIWLVGRLLGWQVNWPQAAAMEAFIGLAKVLGSFVPGSVGVQESGVVLLFRLFGLTPNQALAYALLRRGRELVFAAVGLALLWRQGADVKLLRMGLKHDGASR
jgi:glycosyltransferase 2 family protein